MNINEILDQIERGLEGVTPGPYTFSGVRYKMNGVEWQNIFDGQDRPIIAVSIDPRTLEGFRDGKHLARCDPDTMRAIIDGYRAMEARAEKAERALAEARRDISDAAVTFRAVNVTDALAAMNIDVDVLQQWQARAAAAEAKVARLTKVGGDMRLAIAGYINPEEAARRWDGMENTDD